jgi:hypothetical protein
MKPNIPIIPLPPGDMAQVMLGTKTRHFAKVKPPAQLSDLLIFRCELEGKTYDYMVVLDAHAPLKNARMLVDDPQVLSQLGYPRRSVQPGEVSIETAAQKKKYEEAQEVYGAFTFTAGAKRWETAKAYRVHDIAGDKRWLQDITFHQSTREDALTRAEIARNRQAVHAVEKVLLTKLMQTRAFLYSDVTLARRYGVATPLPMQRAVLKLDDRGIHDAESIHRLFKAAREPLRHYNDHTTPELPTDAFPDGKGYAQFMAASETADINMGRACLLNDRLIDRILLKERPREAAAIAQDKKRAEGKNHVPVNMRLSAQSKRRSDGQSNYHVDLPMTLDAKSEEELNIATMSDWDVQRYGYATLADLKTDLGIKEDSFTLYGYMVEPTPTEELAHDHDRDGSFLDSINDTLHDAWTNGKDGRPSKRSKTAEGSGNNESSIAIAKAYVATLPKSGQRQANSAARHHALSDADIDKWVNRSGTRIVPSDVRAKMIAHGKRDGTGHLPLKDRPIEEQLKAEIRALGRQTSWNRMIEDDGRAKLPMAGYLDEDSQLKLLVLRRELKTLAPTKNPTAYASTVAAQPVDTTRLQEVERLITELQKKAYKEAEHILDYIDGAEEDVSAREMARLRAEARKAKSAAPETGFGKLRRPAKDPGTEQPVVDREPRLNDKKRAFRDLCRRSDDDDLPEFDPYQADRERFRKAPEKGPSRTAAPIRAPWSARSRFERAPDGSSRMRFRSNGEGHER